MEADRTRVWKRIRISQISILSSPSGFPSFRVKTDQIHMETNSDILDIYFRVSLPNDAKRQTVSLTDLLTIYYPNLPLFFLNEHPNLSLALSARPFR